jgi:hypothetical protein
MKRILMGRALAASRWRLVRNRAGEDAAVQVAAPSSLPKQALTEQEAAQYIGMSAAEAIPTSSVVFLVWTINDDFFHYEMVDIGP